MTEGIKERHTLRPCFIRHRTDKKKCYFYINHNWTISLFCGESLLQGLSCKTFPTMDIEVESLFTVSPRLLTVELILILSVRV